MADFTKSNEKNLINSQRVSPPDPRPEGRESRLFFDFLGRESTPEAKKGEKGPRVGSLGREFASNVKLVQCKTSVDSRPLGREKKLGSGRRRAVQAQLGLGPGVRSLAPMLRYGITRGVLSLTCPRTPALCHTASPSPTPDPRLVVNS